MNELEEIRAAREQVKAAEQRWNAGKTAVAGLKKAYDSKLEDLMVAIDGEEPTLDFPADDEADGEEGSSDG